MQLNQHYYLDTDLPSGFLGANDCLRAKAAKLALAHVLANITPDSIIGIGTGATVEVFVAMLAKSGVAFKACVSSSNRSTLAIEKHHLPVMEMQCCDHVDFYIDGIDEGMDNGITVKGGGAALAREKVLATLAKNFITIADSGRKVQGLGQFPLPIEVLPSAQLAATLALTNLAGKVTLRPDCVTDNGNLILDVAGLDMSDPQQMEGELNRIPGVVENGIFSSRRADMMVFSDPAGITLLAENAISITDLSIALSA